MATLNDKETVDDINWTAEELFNIEDKMKSVLDKAIDKYNNANEWNEKWIIDNIKTLYEQDAKMLSLMHLLLERSNECLKAVANLIEILWLWDKEK